jgi:hypothetical protein
VIKTTGNKETLKNFSIWHANLSFPVTVCKSYCCRNFLLFEMYLDWLTICQLPFLYVGFILRKSGFRIKMGFWIICRRYIYVFCNTLYQDADICTWDFRFSQWWILRLQYSGMWRNLLPPYSECKTNPRVYWHRLAEDLVAMQPVLVPVPAVLNTVPWKWRQHIPQ